MRNNRSLIVVVAATAWAASALPSFAQNAFTYQGRIKVDGVVPTGTTYDFAFSLWDDPDPGQGSQIGSTNSFDNLAVTNGLFVADLDFGAEAFNMDTSSNQRWLEITVTTTNGPTALPRQPITATPFSLATRGIHVDGAGNVGIGTSAPTELLSVEGRAYTVGTGGAPYYDGLRVRSQQFASDGGVLLLGKAPGETGHGLIMSASDLDWNSLTLNPFGGNVGIGTTVPSERLEVNGIMKLSAIFTPPVWDSNTFLWSEGGFGARYDSFQHRFDVGPSRTEAMRISDGGYVGIGTASPSSQLHIAGASEPGIKLTRTSTNTDYLLKIENDDTLRIGDAGNIDLVITPNGNVGMGTSEPGTRLQVNAGSGNFGDGGTLGFASTDNAPFAMIGGTLHVNSGGEEQGDLFFSTRPVGPPGQVLTERVRILRDGSVGIGTTAPSTILHVAGDLTVDGLCGTCSDSRFKTNVSPLREALTTLARLAGVGFDWDRAAHPDRGFTDRHQIGFIAQQIREVLPEVVNEGGDGYLSVDYGKLTPVLVEGVKELHGIVQVQDARISQQDQRIADLEARLAKMEDLMGAKEFVGR